MEKVSISPDNIKQDLLEIIDSFNRVRVMVVGDVMLDRYWWGSVHRISPEAPVPVVRLDRSTLSAGGAANVAANITGLSGSPVLVGLIGDDEAGRDLPKVLQDAGVSAERLLTISDRPTTVKTRIVAHNQHVVRIDQEDVSSISEEESTRITEEILKHLPEAHVLVFSDYAKGLLAPRLLQHVIGDARRQNIPVLVDPKGRDYARYSGATMLTPNRIEAAEACGLDMSDQASTELAGEQLLSRFESAAVLITQGEDGMTLFRPGQKALHLEAFARDVYDVTGAGDTVISTLSLALGAGADLASAAKLANMAAGLAVEQVGTTVITFELLRKTVEESLSGSSLKQNVEDQGTLDANIDSLEVFHA